MPVWLVSVASCSSLDVEDKDSLSEELIPFQVLSRRETKDGPCSSCIHLI